MAAAALRCDLRLAHLGETPGQEPQLQAERQLGEHLGRNALGEAIPPAVCEDQVCHVADEHAPEPHARLKGAQRGGHRHPGLQNGEQQQERASWQEACGWQQ